MKKLALITSLVLSLLIVYSGAGISIMQFCCTGCETMQHDHSDTNMACASCGTYDVCNESHEADCHDTGCTTTIYKVDYVKHATENVVHVPVITLYFEPINQLFASNYSSETVDCVDLSFPPPVSSRQKLALHSILII